MAGVSSTGGTALDVNGIVSQLMQIEQQPIVRLNQREASYQAQLSAFGNLKGVVSTFQSAMNSLSDAAKFVSTKATVSDSSVLSAAAGSSATPGTYSVLVSQLAQQQKLVAVGQASMAAAVGTGTLTFDFGTISGGSLDPGTGKYAGASFTSAGGALKTVTIDNETSTLSGIRDAINAAEFGVTATIINDGSDTPYRLVLTSDATGEEASMKITVAGDAALSNLLAHNPAGTQELAETLTAQDAQMTLDGIDISKASNSITDVIPGVTLTLSEETGTTPVSLTVARDTSGVKTSTQSFVDAYNAATKSIASLTSYDPATRVAGPLQGDSTVRMFSDSVRRILSTALTGAGGVTTLSQLGIAFQQDGTLKLDADTLQHAVAANPSDIASAFAQAGRTTDGLLSYSGATSATQSGSYAITVTRLATQGYTAGSDAAALTITAGVNDTLDVTLDGLTGSLTLDAGTYGSADALALHVQSKINAVAAFSSESSAVTVTNSGGVLTLTSNRYGSASVLSVTGGNGASDLLGIAPTEVAGLDVTGTINGVAATGAGQVLRGATDDDSEGLQVQVSGGALGSRGSVYFSRGYAYQMNALAEEFLETTGTLATRTDGINASIRNLEASKDAIGERLALIEERYRKQFTALDAMLARMNQTQSFLSQQLTMLNNIVTPPRD